MNKQKWTCLLVGIALIGGTAFTLNHMKANQRLGPPGIKTTPIPGSKRLEIYLPPNVLDYKSELIPTDTNVLNGLPQDTSFAQRRYIEPDGNWLLCNVVLMGTDRTSIHKPQFCLTGSGWTISDAQSTPDTVRVDKPHSYDLPVMKLTTSRDFKPSGSAAPVTVHGIYVYWFVAENELTESHWGRISRMSSHLLKTGELERWAYISCLAVCRPGDEAATYARVKKFIAASVPEFQNATGAPISAPVSPQAALH